MPAKVPPLPQLAVLLALLCCALPLLWQLPLWVPLLFALLLGWRGYLVWTQRPLPARLWLLPALLLPMAALWLELRTLVGREGGVALLLLLLGGKALESRSLRDWRVLLALGFFLAAMPLLFEQGPLAAACLLLSLLALTWAMALLAGEDARVSPRVAWRALLQSFPLMLLLFVLMPRLPGPLWRMPATDTRASSGLADSMRPGSIGDMILSREAAFTAQFIGLQPRRAQLYWRVMVFDRFDGGNWYASPRQAGLAAVPAGAALQYEISSEPFQGWLPHLEQLQQVGSGVERQTWQRLRRQDAAKQTRLRYRASSVAGDRYREPLDDLAQAHFLRLDAANPRSRAVGLTLAQQFPSPARRLAAIRQWLLAQGLRYTLQPPLLSGDTVDGFLFGSRQGFCEHFASAFTTLARAAGLPARVVVGFQGGEFNTQGRFWLVRSSDAHAWSEVWLDGYWQRVDPTAEAAPQRVMAGIEQTLGETAATLPLLGTRPPAWAQRLAQQWQAAGFAWQQWVVGYDDVKQRGLYQRLGLGELGVASVARALLLGGLLLLPLLYYLLRRPRANPAQRDWQRLLARLRRAGLTVRDSDTAAQLLRQAQHLRVAEQQQLRALLRQWQALHYAPPGDDPGPAWRRWRWQLWRFRPARVGRRRG